MTTTSEPRTCEAKIDGVWRAMTLPEAAAHHAMAVTRCPACHGRVSIHRNYTARGGLSLAHRKGFDGCPLLPDRFNGTPSLHPQALA